MNYDDFMAALCIWREARGELYAVKVGVAWALFNRAHDKLNRWPKTMSEVVLEPGQFSSFDVGNPNATKFPSRKDLLGWQASLACEEAWESVLNAPSTAPDPTGGATNYWDDSISAPAWAKGKAVVKIGNLNFVKA